MISYSHEIKNKRHSGDDLLATIDYQHIIFTSRPKAITFYDGDPINLPEMTEDGLKNIAKNKIIFKKKMHNGEAEFMIKEEWSQRENIIKKVEKQIINELNTGGVENSIIIIYY